MERHVVEYHISVHLYYSAVLLLTLIATFKNLPGWGGMLEDTISLYYLDYSAGKSIINSGSKPLGTYLDGKACCMIPYLCTIGLLNKFVTLHPTMS